MFKLQPISKAVALAFGGVTLAVTCGLASAQTAPAVERVEITGSSIKQIQSESALPVQNYTRQDLERTGATTAAEVIQALPSMQGFTQDTESVGGGGNGYNGVSLHALGDTYTLVLINGRRIAPFAGQTLTGALSGIDLNTIPLSAIERVEILSDGASALYGSDAIGGVVNFILRTNYSEGEVAVGGVVTEGGGAGEKSVSITKGFGDLQKDGYNLLLAASYNKRENMRATQRDFAKTGNFTFQSAGHTMEWQYGSYSAVPGNVYDLPVVDDVTNAYRFANGTCPQYHWADPDTGACLYDFTSSLYIYPEAEKTSLILSGSKKISDNHTLFADVIVASDWMVSKIAPPPVTVAITPTMASYDTIRPMPGFVNGDTYYVGWRGVDAGNRTTKDESTAKHIVVGLKGALGAWDYTTSYTHSTNEWTQTYLAGWLLSNELTAALQAGTINPFLEPGSAAGIAAVQPLLAQGVYKKASTTLDFVEARGSREIGKIAGGSMMLGAGMDWRRERTDYRPSVLAQGTLNNIAGDSAEELPFDLSRTAWGAYAELLAPVTKQVEVTGSVRYDKYSDFGDTTNGKLAVRFQPAQNVLLRASVGTGFKAPTVPQAADIQQSYGVTATRWECPFDVSDPLASLCLARTARQYNVYAAGEPNLVPEKSTQWTLGFRIEPTPKLSIGADLWNVELKDRIGQVTEDMIFGDPVTYRSYFTSYYDPSAQRDVLAIVQANANLGKSKTRGIDLDMKARFDTSVGKLTVRGLGTYMLLNKYQLVPGGEWRTDLGKYNDGSVTFRFQGQLSGTLEYGRFAHTLAMNYKSGYGDAEGYAYDTVDAAWVLITDHRVSSYLTFDWQTKWNLNKQAALSVGIRNLLDTDPPLTLKGDGGHMMGYDNRYTDPRGRFLYANLNYKF